MSRIKESLTTCRSCDGDNPNCDLCEGLGHYLTFEETPRGRRLYGLLEDMRQQFAPKNDGLADLLVIHQTQQSSRSVSTALDRMDEEMREAGEL